MTQYVYKIRSDRFIKIGIANDVQSRIAQLQTGSPYRLELLSCYGFEDASAVERALHQKYSKERGIGEWFSLTDKQMNDFDIICQMLGGEQVIFNGEISVEEVEEAEEIEEIQEAIMTEDKYDYAQMFSDGWRMETANENGKKRNWVWRRGNAFTRKTIYGGSMKSLPYPIEEMRRIYRDGGAS